MSVNYPTTWHGNAPLPSDKIEYKAYAIGGKMVTATIRAPIRFVSAMEEEDKHMMREQLVELLVKDILSKNLCEITKLEDPVTLETTIFARMYLAPNSEVKILRTVA